ncbi:MAG: hypothetical protein ABR564_04420 [Candidatus Dormibacteria bacterium]
MVLIVGLLQLPFGTLHYLTDRSSDLFEDIILVPSGSPPLLLAACFVAMPLARRLTREPRAMGILETLSVGMSIFILFLSFALTVVGVAGEGSPSTSSTATPKPLPTPVTSPENQTTRPPASVSASPLPTAAAGQPPASPPPSGAAPSVSPSPRGAAKPAPSSPARANRLNAGQVFGLALANLAALGATAYIFPMIYRLLWMRGGRRQRNSAQPRGGR